MKRILLVVAALLMLSPALMAEKKIKKGPVAEKAGIHWLDINELQAKMAQSPKKVYIDIYTGWCGWCKKMEASTFTNPALIRYINNNYYCVRLDAERQDDIQFQGKSYSFNPQYKANALAVELMKGQMSYPTSIIMLENFQNPNPIPGYHDVKEMELFLTFFGDGAYKHQQFADFQKSFKPTWDHGAAPDMTPPPGH